MKQWYKIIKLIILPFFTCLILFQSGISQDSEPRFSYLNANCEFPNNLIRTIVREINGDFDKEFTETCTKPELYTNINQGDCTFRLIASDNLGYGGELGASMNLRISPTYWKTWWFRIFVIILIVAFIYGFYQQRIKFYRKQNILLEERVEERTSTLIKLNSELLEKNQRILAQNEEIKKQSELINQKSEEILIQNKRLEEHKREIEKAYEELTSYRTQLEDIVENRTRELIIARDKAQKSDNLKSSFLANMSHEIRTPLNSIIGFSRLISNDDISKVEKNSFLDIIELNSRMLLSLISDIIDFSKIEAGYLDIYKNDLPIHKVLQDIKELYQIEFDKTINFNSKNISFQVIVDENIRDKVLYTDEFRLKQIISIILNNAIKFTDNGTIEFGCKIHSQNLVSFYVRDTGIGIDKKNHGLIFERFQKVEDDLTKLYRGAGLGLSIARQLVQLLDGRVWLESELCKGSVFYFTIPFKPDQEFKNIDMDKLENTQIPRLDGIKILVAEDDITNFLYLNRLLIKAGAIVLLAGNGEEVLKILESDSDIRIILMDIKMPVMDGYEAFKILRKTNPTIPVIAQTAYAIVDEIKEIRNAGFTDYIAKPLDPQLLFSQLQQYLSVKK